MPCCTLYLRDMKSGANFMRAFYIILTVVYLCCMYYIHFVF